MLNSQALRPMAGAVSAQYVTCGKAECRCRTGAKHGPYYYRVWRQGSSIKKEYIRSEDVERVRACCQAHQEILHLITEIRAERRRLSGNIRKSVTRCKRMLHDPW